jgi:hypothetical protein
MERDRIVQKKGKHQRPSTTRAVKMRRSHRKTVGMGACSGLTAGIGRHDGRRKDGTGKRHGKVAFLGLGVMGVPDGGHLQGQGHAVTVWNRTAAKAEAWVASMAGALRHAREAAARGRIS